jgi:hypothetical protein
LAALILGFAWSQFNGDFGGKQGSHRMGKNWRGAGRYWQAEQAKERNDEGAAGANKDKDKENRGEGDDEGDWMILILYFCLWLVKVAVIAAVLKGCYGVWKKKRSSGGQSPQVHPVQPQFGAQQPQWQPQPQPQLGPQGFALVQLPGRAAVYVPAGALAEFLGIPVL